MRPDATNAALVGGGATVTLGFTIQVSEQAPLGSINVGEKVWGYDSSTTAPLSDQKLSVQAAASVQSRAQVQLVRIAGTWSDWGLAGPAGWASGPALPHKAGYNTIQRLSEQPPRLSIVSNASSESTTYATGGDVPRDFGAPATRSLRVTVPVTVTLTASLTDPGAGWPAVVFNWRQVEGPTVILDVRQPSGLRELVSAVAFSPTTSRLHVFEVTASLLDAEGLDSGLFFRKSIRVIVDTVQSSVPEASAEISPTVVPLDGSDAERAVTLISGGSPELASVLSFSWRQVAGPAVTLTNPFAPQPEFTAPRFEPAPFPYEYVFELTTDRFPPGDRSEPVYVSLTQQPPAPATPVTTVQLVRTVLGLPQAALADPETRFVLPIRIRPRERRPHWQ